MYDQRFFASTLGRSAMLSIAAMITFAIFAGAQGQPAAAREASGRIALVTLA